ncbi:MAG: gamma-glutamylcyclotransferase family protein [Pseudomonadota bacterium]
MKATHLFVYGTLAPGRPNHHLLAGLEGTWAKATLKGRLMDEGWGADQGYPGIIPDPDASPVRGHVLSSPELAAHWAMLDEFEGPGYERRSVAVTLASGEALQAWVYALRGN